jgi:hypothetical protein
MSKTCGGQKSWQERFLQKKKKRRRKIFYFAVLFMS